MQLFTFTNEKEYLDSLITKMRTIIVASSSVSRIALSGGSTPVSLYTEMSQRDNFPFHKISVYQVDERYVPQNHESSNYRMIYEALLQKRSDELDSFYFFDTSLPIKESLLDYETHLSDIDNHPFDITILGMGTDGHIASLFPACKELKEKKRKAVHTVTHEHAIKNRLSITLPVILASRHIFLMLKGKEKKHILKKLLHEDISIDFLPAKALLSHTSLSIYYLTQ